MSLECITKPSGAAIIKTDMLQAKRRRKSENDEISLKNILKKLLMAIQYLEVDPRSADKQ